MSTGRISIPKKRVCCTGIPTCPPATTSYSALIANLDQIVLRDYPAASREALSNCHGDWYEWLLAISAWNWHIANPETLLLVRLPNISSFDVSRLYCDRLYDMIVDLRAKVLMAGAVSLITSNPDFVLLSPSTPIESRLRSLPITTIDDDSITELENLYTYFIGRCDFNNIAGFLSVKFSLRPDRRLQLPHEGSLMKALYAHLQTREWVINPPGLRYYACSTSVTPSDRAALQTVATHSITTVFSTPEKAVDDVFEIDNTYEAERVWEQILAAQS